MTHTYLGWSGFLITGGDTRVAVDPHWSSWTGPGALPPWDLSPLDGIVLSHGHGDHSADVPSLLTLHPRAWLAVSPGLADWARELGIGDRLRVVRPRATVDMGEGVELRLVPGVHVGEGVSPQVVRALQYGLRHPMDALHLVKEAFTGPDGGVHSVFLRMPDGRTYLHAAETLHRGTDPGRWREEVAGASVDVLLLGVEPGEERAAALLGAAVDAGEVVTFSPHAEQRAHFGLGDLEDVRWERVDVRIESRRAEPSAARSP